MPKCCRISSVGNGLTMCLAQGAVAVGDPSPDAVCRTWVSLNGQPKTRTHKHTHKRLNALSAGPGWLAGYPSTTDYFGLICHISASVQNQNSIYAQTQAHTHAARQTRPLHTHTHLHIRTPMRTPLSKPGQVLPPAVEPAFSNQELIVIPRCGCRSRFIHNYQ